MSGLVVVGKWSPSLVRVRAKWTERSVGKCNSIELKMSFTRKEIFYEWKLWVSRHKYFWGWKLWILKGYYYSFSKNILDLVLNWLLNWLVKNQPVHFQRTLRISLGSSQSLFTIFFGREGGLGAFDSAVEVSGSRSLKSTHTAHMCGGPNSWLTKFSSLDSWGTKVPRRPNNSKSS